MPAIIRFAALALLSLVLPSVGLAQQPPASILNQGSAVVTGFSGTTTPDPRRIPRNKSAIDLTFIDPDAAAARVFDVRAPGFAWDARNWQAPKTLEVPASAIGQVFGIALDDAAAPNIYLTATSAYGLQIVLPGADNTLERVTRGQARAEWMKGQFGPAPQGGPGSIWKVDGRTGQVSLFANVTLNGAVNAAPGLGNITFDRAHQQLFVSDLSTGLIYRFDLTGRALSTYDHGATARPARSLPPVALDPARRVEITDARFDSENPDTWGFAAPERRVYALAINKDGRLYYSVWDGPQIWSVGIAPDGSLGNDPRWELDVATPRAFPVSDMVFSDQGAMILAQRGGIVSSYDYSVFARPSEARVLRYRLEQPDDLATPSRWVAQPDEYAIGFRGDFRNTNGGVDLGYGYTRDGRIDLGSCATTLWTTGESLRDNPTYAGRLRPGGPFIVHGLQASPADQVRDRNTPPFTAYFIDYDGRYNDARASGHIGSVRIMRADCTPAIATGPSVTAPSQPPSGPPPLCPQGFNPDGTCGRVPIDLSLKKTVSDPKFDPKTGTWTFQYTLVVTNVGNPFTPGNHISISDPLPNGLTFTAAAGTNWDCSATTFPLSSGNLNCVYNYGPGQIATGAALPPLVITVTVTKPGKYDNCGRVGTTGAPWLQETTQANNRDCVPVEIKYPPNNVTVVKSESLGGPCSVGALCIFTITVTNNSPWPFNGPVSIGDSTGVPMTVASTDLPCNPLPTATPFTCTATLNMPAGPSSQTFTISGIIPVGSVPETSQTATNCANVGAPPPNSPWPGLPSTVVSDVKDCKQYVVCGFQCHMTQTQIDQIKIDKKANATECTPGGQCSFTYTISNMSTMTPTAFFPITFLDTMPAGAATFMPPPSPSPPWSCLPFGPPGQIKCLHPPGSIPAGGQISVTVTYTISPGYTQPTLTNCSEFFVGDAAIAASHVHARTLMDARQLREYLRSRGVTVAPTTTPILGPDDKSCATVNIHQPPKPTDVAIKKTVSTSPVPQVIDYYFTLAVTNVGGAFNGQNVITVTDVVPAGMTFTSISAGANFTCAPAAPIPAGGTLTCTYTGTGPTAPNQALGSIYVTGTASTPPPFTNCAVVGFTPASGLTDANPPDNQSCINVIKPPFPAAAQACDPRTTVKRGNECVCRFPNMVKGTDGGCMCATGMNFAAGRGCVPPLKCDPPKVPNAANTACVCPPDTVQRGRECVKPPVCTPPMIQAPGAPAGTCICPPGTVQRGRECVKPPVCQPPMIQAPGVPAGICICPPGTVQRGRECVKSPVCTPPMIQIPGAPGCMCPPPLMQRGRECVRPGPTGPTGPQKGTEPPRNPGAATPGPIPGAGPSRGPIR